MAKLTYRRNLPHYLPDDAPYFVTTRLVDSIPVPVLKRLQFERETAVARAMNDSQRLSAAQRRYFRDWDCELDAAASGPTWLRDAQIASIVAKGIEQLEEESQVVMLAWTIMPNHIHLLFNLCDGNRPLYDVMKLLKGRSARAANMALQRSGSFWQDESYDHVVRNGELGRIAEYIIMNPVKARLVANWRDYLWTFLHPRFEGF